MRNTKTKTTSLVSFDPLAVMPKRKTEMIEKIKSQITPYISKMEVGRGCIVIPKRQAHTIGVFLNKNYPKMSFRKEVVGENVRIFRRS